jgi:iron-sulfur cluster repair protein YtfE (RIC family)
MKMCKVTLNQFNNILAFIALMGTNKYVLELNPDYIIDKYERYIGDPSKVSDDIEHFSGLHPVLREQIIDSYHQIWRESIETTIVRSEKINMVVNGYKPAKPMSKEVANDMKLMLKLFFKHKQEQEQEQEQEHKNNKS